MSVLDNPLRAFFIGCVKSSDLALASLLSDPDVEIVGVLTMAEASINSDYVDISVRAKEADVPFFYAEDMDDAQFSSLLRKFELDVVFVIGWSRLLGGDVLTIPKFGAVGYHPAALPRNRGRHPLIWSLALGLSETASTFFSLDLDADSGPILSQVPLAIDKTDYAADLYAKALSVIPDQLREVVAQLNSGLAGLKPQDHVTASYWRKRGLSDGSIDWRMAAETIYNLVRALSHPYPGAEFMVGQSSVRVWRCEVVESEVPQDAEPGKVLAIGHKGVVVKAGIGAVLLVDTSGLPDCLRLGDYL